MDLPVELAGAIARHSNQRTLQALCLVSHTWYDTATRELYAMVDLTRASSESNITTKFLWMVVSQPILGSYVQSLDIYNWGPPIWNVVDHSAVSLFTLALRAMPNLQHLGARTIYHVIEADQTCEDAFSCLARLESFYSGHCGTFDMGRVLKRLPPLRRFAWDCSPSVSYVAELEALIMRSQDKLEGLAVEGFDINRILHNRSVSFPRLQMLAVGEEIDFADLNRSAFASVTGISACSFRSMQSLGQRNFLPKLSFIRTGTWYGNAIFGLMPLSGFPRTSPKRVLQHVSVDAMDIRDPEQGQAFPEMEIFNHAEVKSLAIELYGVEEVKFALRALAKVGVTTDLNILAFHIKPPEHTIHELVVQIIEFAAQGQLPNVRFLHLREQQHRQEDWGFRDDPVALKATIDRVSHSRALLAQALPSLEVFELVIIPLSWKTTAAIRWTRLVPSKGHAQTISISSAEKVVVPIQSIGKHGGRFSKISWRLFTPLSHLRRPPNTASLLVPLSSSPAAPIFRRTRRVTPPSVSANERSQVEEVWDIEEFDRHSALPSPWPDYMRDLHKFISIIDRYTIE